MIENFIAIYVLIDDTMIEIGHKEPFNRNSSDSELIAVALMAANSKMPHEPWQNFLISDSRKRIETTFSQISSMLPKRIHAVTIDGFLMKVIFFLFGFTINELT